MTWKEVCDDTSLQDLPYKVELNEWGQIVMSPADFQHSSFQGEIIRLLNQHLPEGRAIPECAVETVGNTKVPDVVWISQERFQAARGRASCPIAPEICIEILSPSNPRAEMLGSASRPGKRELYFKAGALEFWLCDEDGRISFFQPAGAMERSALCPEFPASLSWFS
jgi:Uma2 family endonuclease